MRGQEEEVVFTVIISGSFFACEEFPGDNKIQDVTKGTNP